MKCQVFPMLSGSEKSNYDLYKNTFEYFLCCSNDGKHDPRHLGAAKRSRTIRAQQKGRRTKRAQGKRAQSKKGAKQKGRRAKRAQSKKGKQQKGREITMLRHRYIQGRNFFR